MTRTTFVDRMRLVVMGAAMLGILRGLASCTCAPPGVQPQGGQSCCGGTMRDGPDGPCCIPPGPPAQGGRLNCIPGGHECCSTGTCVAGASGALSFCEPCTSHGFACSTGALCCDTGDVCNGNGVCGAACALGHAPCTAATDCCSGVCLGVYDATRMMKGTCSPVPCGQVGEAPLGSPTSLPTCCADPGGGPVVATNGICGYTRVGAPARSNADCAPPLVDIGGQCQPCVAQGQTVSASSECCMGLEDHAGACATCIALGQSTLGGPNGPTCTMAANMSNSCCSGSTCCLPLGGNGDPVCRDLLTDVDNCGGCGTRCPYLAGGSRACRNGICTGSCAGTVPCPSAINPSSCVPSNDANCGTCGTVCRSGEHCSGGRCDSTCVLPNLMCGSTCADVQTDSMNCGSCGHACGANMRCVAGMCSNTCTPVSQPCNNAGTGCCTGLTCQNWYLPGSSPPAVGGAWCQPPSDAGDNGSPPEAGVDAAEGTDAAMGTVHAACTTCSPNPSMTPGGDWCQGDFGMFYPCPIVGRCPLPNGSGDCSGFDAGGGGSSMDASTD